MKNKSIYLVLFLSLTFILSSCTQRLVDFTIISTKNIDLSKAATFERAKKRNTGTDRVYWLISIPLGIPNMKEAIDRAIEQTPGSVALVDGVVYTKSMWFILSGFSEYIVEGTPLIDPALSLETGELESQFNFVQYDKNGALKEIKPLTEEEYNLKAEQIKSNKLVRVK